MNPQPKAKRYESPQYLDFIRGLPCVVCGEESEPHHTKSVGSGGSDLTCIPLCRRDHTEFHLMGLVRFEIRYAIDTQRLRARLLEAYVVQLEQALYGREH